MNGIESYIFKKYQNEEMGWLPVNRAICFDEEESDNNEELEDKIDGILGKIKTMESIMGEDSDESTNDEGEGAF